MKTTRWMILSACYVTDTIDVNRSQLLFILLSLSSHKAQATFRAYCCPSVQPINYAS